MGKLITYQDIHVGAPNQVMNSYELAEQTKYDLRCGHTVVWNGDIFDLANCRKNDVEWTKDLAEYWLDVSMNESGLFKNFYYNTGNHERLDTRFDSRVIVHEGVRYYFTHGDEQSNRDRYLKYRMKSHGAGWLKRKLWVPALSRLEKIIERTPSDRMLKACSDVAMENDCSVFVGGHIHLDYNKRIRDGLPLVVFFDQGRREVVL